MPIAVDTMRSNDRIEQLEALSGKQHRRPKASNMFWQMHEDVEFWFIEPARRETTRAVQEILNRGFKLNLCHKIHELRHLEGPPQRLTR